MLLSLRIDRMYDKHIVWNHDLQDPNSEQYQQLQWEASRAVSTTYENKESILLFNIY